MNEKVTIIKHGVSEQCECTMVGIKHGVSEQCECTMVGMENLSQKTIGNKYIDMCTAYSQIIITCALN